MLLDIRNIDEVSEQDLLDLIPLRVEERKRIDYQVLPPPPSDRGRNLLLRDVSSFANAAGGWLVYGMEEESGLPVRLSGFELSDPEDETLRLLQWIRTGIDPKIVPQVDVRPLRLSSGRYAIIVKVPSSWTKPHRVATLKATFFSRNSKGRQDMDTLEIRNLIRLTEGFEKTVRTFRAERVEQIFDGRTPITIESGPSITVHLIPFGAFSLGTRFDVTTFYENLRPLVPIGGGSTGRRINVDGIVTFLSELRTAYTQLFWNGTLEAHSVLPYRPGETLIASLDLERDLLEAIPRYLEVIGGLGADPPIVAMISLLYVSGYALAPPARFGSPLDRRTFDRSPILLPELVLEGTRVQIQDLRPLMDDLWRASGWAGSPNFKENGEYLYPVSSLA